MKLKWRPQILVAMLCLATLGGMTIVLAPDYIEVIASGVVTGIAMLGMKLLEGE